MAREHSVCVVHGAGPQISAEMERLGLDVTFVGGRRVTTEAGLAVVRDSFAAVNREICAALGLACGPALRRRDRPAGDTCARARARRRGAPVAAAAVAAALEAGSDPGRRAAGGGSVERQCGRGCGRARDRARRRADPLPDGRSWPAARRRRRRDGPRRRGRADARRGRASQAGSFRSSGLRSTPRGAESTPRSARRRYWHERHARLHTAAARYARYDVTFASGQGTG